MSGSCDRCGKVGHVGRDCPMRSACKICGMQGHMARLCPAKTCDICGRVGHERSDCQRRQGGQGTKCYECGQPGHMSRNCPNASAQQHRRRFVPPEILNKQHEQGQFMVERARAISEKQQKQQQERLEKRRAGSGLAGDFAAVGKKARTTKIHAGLVTIMKKENGSRGGGGGGGGGEPPSLTSSSGAGAGAGAGGGDGEREGRFGGAHAQDDGGKTGGCQEEGGLGLLAAYGSGSDSDG